MLVGSTFFGLLQIALHWPPIALKSIESGLVQSESWILFLGDFINLFVSAV